MDPSYTRAPLMRRIYNNGGMPIKTKLAIAFPLLTRRERRAELRDNPVATYNKVREVK